MKKNLHFISLAMLASVLLFSSCGKKSDDPAPSNPTNNTSNPPVTTGSYYPTTTGNTWNYSGAKGNYTTTSTGVTQQYNGHSYSQMKQVTANSTTPNYGYIFKDGNKYYVYEAAGSVALNLKLIDLDLPIGTTWEEKVASNVYTDVTYTFKVTGTSLTRTVNGIAYSDVISVQLITSYQLSSTALALYGQYMTQEQIAQLQSTTSQQNFQQTTYYALNVGMIEQTSTTTPALAVKLLSSTIK